MTEEEQKENPFEKLLLKALGLNRTEFTLLKFMFGQPEGEYVTSVTITKGIGVAQSNISAAAKKLIDFGWIESSTRGYARIKPVEVIKKDMIARYKKKVASITS